MTGNIKKFVAIGPESTGKSTLCRLLADHYHTIWCPEYAREYLETHGSRYTYDDLYHIARGQIRLEKQTFTRVEEKRDKNLLFVDTDMHVMRVWCEYVYGNCYPLILDEIAINECDGYFLCAPDLPWEADDLREYPDQKTRDELFLYYQEILTAQHVPWVVINGDYEERLKKAVAFVELMMKP